MNRSEQLVITPTVIGHQVFRTVLQAFSEPGLWVPLPVSDTAPMAVCEAVLDAIWEADNAPLVIIGQPVPGQLTAAERGTEVQPELGATVVFVMDWTDEFTDVLLSGPGISGRRSLRLPLSAAALAERAEACALRPCGIDLLLIGLDGSVLGLPRSTALDHVES